jgi:hypothetical protein
MGKQSVWLVWLVLQPKRVRAADATGKRSMITSLIKLETDG